MSWGYIPNSQRAIGKINVCKSQFWCSAAKTSLSGPQMVVNCNWSKVGEWDIDKIISMVTAFG